MSKNAEDAFEKLHKIAYEPITEDIVDWCIRGSDAYREPSTLSSLTPHSSPSSHHQQMKRRRKKKNSFTQAAVYAAITHHQDSQSQSSSPPPATAAPVAAIHSPPQQLTPLLSPSMMTPTKTTTFNNHLQHLYPLNIPDIATERKAARSSQYYEHNNSNYGNSNSLNLYYLYGDSLARCGQLREAFDIYAFIASNYLDGCVPLARLKVLSSTLIDYISSTQASKTTPSSPVAPAMRRVASSSLAMESNSTISGAMGASTLPLLSANTNSNCDRVRYSKNKRIQRFWKDGGAGGASSGGGRYNDVAGLCDESHVDFCDTLPNDANSTGLKQPISLATEVMELDPLMCPQCRDILRCPVTANCGHSFCRDCCEAATMCPVCRVKFPTSVNSVAAAAAAVVKSSEFPQPPSSSSSSDQMMASLYNSYASASQYMNFTSDRGGPTPARAITNTAALLHNNNNNITNSSGNGNGSGSGSVSVGNYHPHANGNNNISMKFMPDVLVRRLVDKWWGADLQAKTINERAASFLSLNLLDDALKFCNVSLEKCPNNFNSLLLRAEVLRRLNHYQSSLADIDHALRRKSSSAKAHYHRSLALCGLGRLDEALVDHCLAVCFDTKNSQLSSTELFQHDLAKLLQKLLAQSPKKIHLNSLSSLSSSSPNSAPYDIVLESRQRRKQIVLQGASFKGDECIINATDATTDCDLLRQGSRKHCRRKSYSINRRQQQQQQKPQVVEEKPTQLVNFFGSARFDSILERTQQEVQRIKESESNLSQEQQRHLLPVNPNLIDASDFDCVLCCRTFWKPVVTPCGHTYCWVCLDRCMDYSPSCPLCMSPLVEQHVNVLQGSSSPVPFILAKRPVTKFLEAAMKRFIPECYEKRFQQEMDLEPSVPVFICTTAFPHVPCPLFVYEPRYRLMVRRAVESGEKQFGIVQPHSGKSRYFDVGTILDIRDCVLLGDGCSILSTVGCKRFRILARNEKDGYETAKVEYIYDEIITEDTIPFISSMHASVLSKAIEWYESLGTEIKEEILRSFGGMPAVEDNWESIADGPAWAWWIIALLPLNQQLKVDILATTSLEKRLRAIEKTLDCMSGTFKRSQQSCVVVHRECIQPCQAVECCQRSSSELSSSSDSHAPSEHSHLML
ncbi:uncharacterized protein LOC129945526 [Eupeodes corollae]|uniref:uncharacterized protein LOC129945526 n=1 Tax=Eupeodes corollae TaxID=290404 RepID=UPI00249399E0|nr:uncharacterized protein LOC129945526 [Eupeodes corollae]